jgi:hypothetical protein
MPARVESPSFHFCGCSEIRESLGQRADSKRRELLITRHPADNLQMMRLHAA